MKRIDWIACKDLFPPYDMPVITYRPNHWPFFTIDSLEYFRKEQYDWYNGSKEEITHWMLIPKPPKLEKECPG